MTLEAVARSSKGESLPSWRRTPPGHDPKIRGEPSSAYEPQAKEDRILDLNTLPLFRVPGRQLASSPPIADVVAADAPLVRALQLAVVGALSNEPLLRDLTARLHNAGLRYGILGGWVRDQLLSVGSQWQIPRDIDLVVDDTTHAELSKLLPPPPLRTILGGFTYRGAQLSIDLWAAKDTFLTTRLGLPSDLPHVLAVTDFNINAVVFLPAQLGQPAMLLDGGALASLATRTISFHFEQIALPLAQVARLLSFSIRLGFAFDRAVATFIGDHCSSLGARDVVRDDLAYRYSIDHVSAALRLLDSILGEELTE